MKNNEKLESRRSFLTFKKSESKKDSGQAKVTKSEKIKMLTPDGNLVEVDRSVLEKSKSRKKASKEDIHFWGKDDSGSKNKRAL